MKVLWPVMRLMLQGQRRPLLLGGLLSVAVLVMGTALLGLSGWFITASAVAGLAGLGASFDVFRPSAMVRFLALGRTAARYGERVTTHDATLRTLAALRVRMLARLSTEPWERLIRLRRAAALNRMMADVDALDGIPLRLILPLGAGLATLPLGFGVLWWLVGPAIAGAVVATLTLGAAAVFAIAAHWSRRPSAEAEARAQAFRAGLVDLLRARADLMVYGRLPAEARALAETDRERRALEAGLDRTARQAGAALTLVSTVAVAASLWIGLTFVEGGHLIPALAALGVFTALGLGEAIGPLARAVTGLGRMRLAAGRMGPALAQPPAPDARPAPAPLPGAPVLDLAAVTVHRRGAAAPVLADFNLAVRAGETVALTGASGAGKSTLLALAAGLVAPDTGAVIVLGSSTANWPEPALRSAVTLVSQRAALIAGSVRDNLALAAPDATDTSLAAALDAVALSAALEPRGGLDLVLGPGGAGLSGGQARRLVLARALLRRPALLLLDEPTEGLDRATAARVLSGIRASLPGAAIVVAAHREAEWDWADRTVTLT